MSNDDGKPSELPSVEDRTMFLGCLTHIVVSSYNYDLALDNEIGDAVAAGMIMRKASQNSTGSGGIDSNIDKAMKPPPKQVKAVQAAAPLEEQASMYFDDEDGSEILLGEEQPTVKDAGQKDPSNPSSPNTTTRNVNKDNDAILKEANRQARQAKVQEKMKLAEQRFFVRRYTVAQDFVSSAAKHLLLDETSTTIQNDFLTQLENLLEPTTTTTTKTTNTTTKSSSRRNLQSDSSESLQSLDSDHTLQAYLSKISSPQAAYKCLSWLLFQYLLQDAKTIGYDARVRFWFRRLAVTIWVWTLRQADEDGNDNPKTDNSSSSSSTSTTSTTKQELYQKATRKFESLESCCAERLLILASTKTTNAGDSNDNDNMAGAKRKSSWGRSIWKGIQVGSVGAGVGVLLMVTGGLAAPGIAAGLAALGMGAVAGTFLSLASSAAVVSLFGVAGGSLAAYKMNRRVSGLTEFTIHHELLPSTEDDSKKQNNGSNKNQQEQSKPHLFRTICVSGWLRDKSDFQRPWGVTPTNPPIADKVELLQRFYHVHNPDLVPYAEDIWKRNQEDADRLWKLLQDKYGRNPDYVFGTTTCTSKDKNANPPAGLTEEEIKLLDQMIVAIGKVEGGEKPEKDKPVQKAVDKEAPAVAKKDNNKENKEKAVSSSNFTGWGKNEELQNSGFSISMADFEKVQKDDSNIKQFEPSAHLATVWNYPQRYGGELYTITWESEVLVELSDSVRKLAVELTTYTGQQVLKTTVAATLVFAAALPLTVISIMNGIDETWTLVFDRADQAGKELALSLLVNKGGHRPITLVGYSWGARVIYSCLKELAQYQQKWEEYQTKKREKKKGGNKEKRNVKDVCKVGGIEFDREPASIVEDAIMMGMPKYLNLSVWKACREVVAGRLVNVYSRKDKILSFMFRYNQILSSYRPVVGTCTVAVPGVENIDVTDLVSSHQDYSSLAGQILQRVRHGQPVRLSLRALDEVALLQKAENLAKGAENVAKEAEHKLND